MFKFEILGNMPSGDYAQFRHYFNTQFDLVGVVTQAAMEKMNEWVESSYGNHCKARG